MVGLEDKAKAFAKTGEAGSANDALFIARWGTSEWATLFSYGTVVKLPGSRSPLGREISPFRSNI